MLKSPSVLSQADTFNAIDKLVKYYAKQIKFLESYYRTELKKPKLVIEFSRSATTSSYHPGNDCIKIAYTNLDKIMRDFYSVKYKVFYSLLLHEIGHAIYTGQDIPFSVAANVLEDNRIEKQIESWNGRTHFRMLRYAFQDKVLSIKQFNEILKASSRPITENNAIYKYSLLAVLRTINNKDYVDELMTDIRNVELVAKLLKVAKTYENNNSEANFVSDHTSKETVGQQYDIHNRRRAQLTSLIKECSDLLIKILENLCEYKQQKQEEKQQQDNEDEENETDNEKSDKSDDNDNEPETEGSDGIGAESKETDDTETEDENEELESETKSEEQESAEPETEDDTDEDDTDDDVDNLGKGNTEGSSNSEETEQSEQEQLKKELEQLEQQLVDALYQQREQEQALSTMIGTLTNFERNTETYPSYNIQAFTTARRSGIKGSATLQTTSGNLKQLNMRKYARRNVVDKPEKLFDKTTDSAKGGKSAKIMFYIDISGSMQGQRLKMSVDYLRNFYDKLNTHLEIRMFAFGSNSYEITRNELNVEFLEEKLEGSTSPRYIKPAQGEEVVILTDGGWGVPIPEEYRTKAHFILVDMTMQAIEENRILNQFKNCRNLHFVDTIDIAKGFERATAKIKDKLRR
jgi:hypothetical protein